jgi:hypothetical protein
MWDGGLGECRGECGEDMNFGGLDGGVKLDVIVGGVAGS